MVSIRNDYSAMFSHEKKNIYNFEKRCGELVKFNWIHCLCLAGGPPSRYLILRTFLGGIRYGPKPCEGRTDDHHY